MMSTLDIYEFKIHPSVCMMNWQSDKY